jgi:1-acyl-sn-glycerol-3-phosphate acyltransferase
LRGGRGAGVAVPTITLEVGAKPAADRAAPEDPFGLDLPFRQRVIPAFRFLHDRYWRVEVTGAHHVPASGPALLVSNHSGAIPFDGAMICTALEKHRARTVRFLYDRFVENLGPVSAFYRKVGGAVASRENAATLLRAGEPLLLFPEGVPGVAKAFGDRYRLRGFNPGFARLALALDVPIVPVAVVGAEEIYPLVGRMENFGRALGMPYLPITPFFPMLGVLGTLPLPTKWFIRFGKPIHLPPIEGEARWQRARTEAVQLRRKIQAMVTRLRNRRQSVFFG